MDPWSEFLSSLRITEIGASGIVVVVVFLILKGWLVTKSHVDQWREAYFRERERADKMQQQMGELTRVLQVTGRVLDALPTMDGGDSDVAESTAETRRRRRLG